MNVMLDSHTLKRAEERGTDEIEIKEVLRTGVEFVAKNGRKGKAKTYTYQKERLGRYYEHKRVEVIYTEENDTIITITVYVFYGKWEEER